MSLGARLKAARATLRATQEAFAAQSGIPLDTLRKYEGDKRHPGAEALAGAIRAGINANWLLTGEGPMLLKDLVGEKAKPEPIDERVLAICIQGISEADPNCPPHKAARLAVEFYARFKAMEKEKDQAA